MKIYRIFLASSFELIAEREKLSRLCLEINKQLKRHNCRIFFEKWEHLDASMSEKHKQAEYNDTLSECQIAFVLFHTRAGKYTQEELDLANSLVEQENDLNKVHVFFKESDSPQTQELTDLKAAIGSYTNCTHSSFSNNNQLFDKVLELLNLYFIETLEVLDSPLVKSVDDTIQVESLNLKSQPKPINFFIVGDTEIERDKDSIADLALYLNNKIINQYNLELELYYWDQTNKGVDQLRNSDIGLVLYHTKFGSFTENDMETAYQCCVEERKPEKLFVFFKETNDTVPQQLQDFKQQLVDKYGYFYCTYSNKDSMLLQFYLQFEVYLKAKRPDLKENSLTTINDTKLLFDDYIVCDLKNIPFANSNSKFNELYKQISTLDEEIADLKSKTNLDDFERNNLVIEQKQLERSRLSIEYNEQINYLFNTALYIAELSDTRVTCRTSEAISLFEQGKSEEANALLDRTNADATLALSNYRTSKAINQQSRSTLVILLKELKLRTKTSMLDDSLPYDKRFTQARAAHEKRIEISKEIDNENDEHVQITKEYIHFLEKYGYYTEALIIAKDLEEFILKSFGMNDTITAGLYNDIGLLCDSLGNLSEGLKYCKMAVGIYETVKGKTHHQTATGYMNLGCVYITMENYDMAMTYCKKAHKIFHEQFNDNHEHSAACFRNIARIYLAQKNFDLAIEYYNKASEISSASSATNHSEVSLIVILADVYSKKGEFETAIEYCKRALRLLSNQTQVSGSMIHCLETLAQNHEATGNYEKAEKCYQKAVYNSELMTSSTHSSTARLYNSIGLFYTRINKTEEAHTYLNKALSYCENNLPPTNSHLSTACNNISILYANTHDLANAIKYSKKALEINKKLYGYISRHVVDSHNHTAVIYLGNSDYSNAVKHLSEALSITYKLDTPDELLEIQLYHNIGQAHYGLNNHKEALRYYLKSLPLEENKFKDSLRLAVTYDYIGREYHRLKDFEKSLEYSIKALKIRKIHLGPNHIVTSENYRNVALSYVDLQDYSNAQKYFLLKLEIEKEELGLDHEITIGTYNDIGFTYLKLKDYQTAIDYFNLSILYGKNNKERVNKSVSFINIGIAKLGLQEYEAALMNLKKAEKIDQFLFNEDDQRMKMIYGHISTCHDKLGNSELAELYRERAR